MIDFIYFIYSCTKQICNARLDFYCNSNRRFFFAFSPFLSFSFSQSYNLLWCYSIVVFEFFVWEREASRHTAQERSRSIYMLYVCVFFSGRKQKNIKKRRERAQKAHVSKNKKLIIIKTSIQFWINYSC